MLESKAAIAQQAGAGATEAWPIEIRLSADKRVLKMAFDDGSAFDLDAEYLRVLSPSAEVRGHGPADRQVIGGKQQVSISALEPVGNYALRIVFSDGHDTGLFSWPYLHKLGREHAALWAGYLAELKEKGLSRDH